MVFAKVKSYLLSHSIYQKVGKMHVSLRYNNCNLKEAQADFSFYLRHTSIWYNNKKSYAGLSKIHFAFFNIFFSILILVSSTLERFLLQRTSDSKFKSTEMAVLMISHFKLKNVTEWRKLPQTRPHLFLLTSPEPKKLFYTVHFPLENRNTIIEQLYWKIYVRVRSE